MTLRATVKTGCAVAKKSWGILLYVRIIVSQQYKFNIVLNNLGLIAA
jgi:hypothetical protein